ncbi:MAG: hypothetical protein BWY93_00800 [Euryarchaeota archaeon ADurb.BinA087]|nr:MAG: hypothetical protein BWY93_00800 [Euryarchaeota archaeon ADurb.BinA087]
MVVAVTGTVYLLAPALPLPLSGCSVDGTVCRPARPSGHSPGERAGGEVPNQQRRAVLGTVREERVLAAGDEEPATKSRASSLLTVQDERLGRRCERNGPEGVESSTVDRQHVQATENQRSGGRHRTQ